MYVYVSCLFIPHRSDRFNCSWELSVLTLYMSSSSSIIGVIGGPSFSPMPYAFYRPSCYFYSLDWSDINELSKRFIPAPLWFPSSRPAISQLLRSPSLETEFMRITWPWEPTSEPVTIDLSYFRLLELDPRFVLWRLSWFCIWGLFR